jgi:hypothetical protein
MTRLEDTGPNVAAKLLALVLPVCAVPVKARSGNLEQTVVRVREPQDRSHFLDIHCRVALHTFFILFRQTPEGHGLLLPDSHLPIATINKPRMYSIREIRVRICALHLK